MPDPAGISDTALVVIVACATLLGSAVGGGITGFVTMRAERRRQDFTRARDAERDDRELRKAGRLVLEELNNGEMKVGVAHAEGHFWLRPQDSLSTAQWNEHRATLASYLDDETWTAVAAAFAWLDRLNWVVLEAEMELDLEGAPAHRIEVTDVDELEAAWHTAGAAKRALHAVGVSGPGTLDELDMRPPEEP